MVFAATILTIVLLLPIDVANNSRSYREHIAHG